MIRIENLHKVFGPIAVLRGVDLTVEDAKTTTILGLSGSGKSTILKHIVGLTKPTSGKVFVGDDEVTALRGRELERVRRKFGVVFQNAALLQSMSVFDNVALPLREHGGVSESEIFDRVIEKCRLVRLIEKDWDKIPAELSGGMRKRAGVARAIIEEPEYILYDEPTTGLDPIITNMVNNLIIEMREKLGVTSIVISHDVDGAARTSDNMAILFDGKIIETGPPERILNSDNLTVRQLIRGDVRGPMTQDEETIDQELATGSSVIVVDGAAGGTSSDDAAPSPDATPADGEDS